MQFDGSAIDGFSRVQETDVLARPDPNTFELLPWGDGDGHLGPHVLRHRQPRRHAVRGRPPPGAAPQPRPRPATGASVLRRPRDGVLLLRRRRPDPAHPSRSTPARTSTSPPPTSPATCASARSTRSRRWASRSSTRYHEDAPSQHEIDLRYTDALTMADNVMTFRLVVKEIALERGVHATFMPKPLAGRAGLGHAHPLLAVRGRHQRLPRPRRRARPVEGRPRASSPACCTTPARSPPSPTSGSTPTSGWWSATRRPIYIVLGPQQPLGGRQRAARKGARPESTRIEYRAPDPACNPYLAFSVILAAGLKGIEEGYELPPRRPPTSTSSPPRSAWPRASTRCRSRCPTRST